MRSLRLLILSDRRPGHFNLSEGIAAAVGRLRPAVVNRLDVSRGRWPGAALAALTTSHLPAAALLSRVYGIAPADLPDADVVISAGAETLAANIWVARILQAPNIFYGSLRLFDADDFKLVLTSYPARANRPNHAVTLKPSPVDPDRNPPLPGNPVPPVWPPRHMALVVGGDAPGIRYSDSDWQTLVAAVRQIHERWGTTVTAANSRRTPEVANRYLADASGDPGSGITQFIDYRIAGPGTLAPAIAGCDLALCTVDSSSMLSECVWLRRRAIAVEPAVTRLERNEAAYRSWMAGNAWTGSLAITALTPDRLRATCQNLNPLASNPLEDLASLIQAKLPGPNLRAPGKQKPRLEGGAEQRPK